MGAEFLVAILWGVVVIYWVWSRRPAFGDSIGLFRNELHALEHAAPVRVPPANRRRPLPYTVSVAGYPLGGPQDDPAPSTAGTAPSVPSSLPEALAAASLSAKRLKARRRRRDVLSVSAGSGRGHGHCVGRPSFCGDPVTASSQRRRPGRLRLSAREQDQDGNGQAYRAQGAGQRPRPGESAGAHA